MIYNNLTFLFKIGYWNDSKNKRVPSSTPGLNLSGDAKITLNFCGKNSDKKIKYRKNKTKFESYPLKWYSKNQCKYTRWVN